VVSAQPDSMFTYESASLLELDFLLRSNVTLINKQIWPLLRDTMLPGNELSSFKTCIHACLCACLSTVNMSCCMYVVGHSKQFKVDRRYTLLHVFVCVNEFMSVSANCECMAVFCTTAVIVCSWLLVCGHYLCGVFTIAHGIRLRGV